MKVVDLTAREPLMTTRETRTLARNARLAVGGEFFVQVVLEQASRELYATGAVEPIGFVFGVRDPKTGKPLREEEIIGIRPHSLESDLEHQAFAQEIRDVARLAGGFCVVMRFHATMGQGASYAEARDNCNIDSVVAVLDHIERPEVCGYARRAVRGPDGKSALLPAILTLRNDNVTPFLDRNPAGKPSPAPPRN